MSILLVTESPVTLIRCTQDFLSSDRRLTNKFNKIAFIERGDFNGTFVRRTNSRMMILVADKTGSPEILATLKASNKMLSIIPIPGIELYLPFGNNI
jgi:hypothetical protein